MICGPGGSGKEKKDWKTYSLAVKKKKKGEGLTQEGNMGVERKGQMRKKPQSSS